MLFLHRFRNELTNGTIFLILCALYVCLVVSAHTSVMVDPPSSSLSTGDPLSLNCSIMLASEVVSGTSLEVVWTLPNGSFIMTDSSGTGSGATLTGTGTSYTSILSITSLTASSAGTYTCSAALLSTIPLVTSSETTMGSSNVTIQGEPKCII